MLALLGEVIFIEGRFVDIESDEDIAYEEPITTRTLIIPTIARTRNKAERSKFVILE